MAAAEQSKNSRGGRGRGRDTRRPFRQRHAAAGRPSLAFSANRTEAPRCCTVCTTGAPNYKCPKCRAIYCSIACCRKHKEEFCSANVPEKSEGEISRKVDPSITGSSDPFGGASAAAKLPAPRSKYILEADIPALNEQKQQQQQQQKEARKRRRQDYDDDLETGWKITEDMVNAMHNSTWLREELADKGLQHLITRIASASPSVTGGGSRNNHNKKGGNATTAAAATTAQEQLLDELTSSNPQFKLFLDKLLVTTGILERQGSDANVDLSEWLRLGPQNDGPMQLQLKPLPSGRVASVPETSSNSRNSDDRHEDHPSSSSDDDDDDDDASSDASCSFSDDP